MFVRAKCVVIGKRWWFDDECFYFDRQRRCIQQITRKIHYKSWWEDELQICEKANLKFGAVTGPDFGPVTSFKFEVVTGTLIWSLSGVRRRFLGYGYLKTSNIEFVKSSLDTP